ncbi:TetR/AcrR family transcriptional regulator [Pseudonocardia sp. TRM90224]|uniref:TetR/AcrR family transcriptional regulator n=1 Tax=Pseudonocardia sp. TRM90224 TaxID=2812678 RepID=UPI001E32CB29|nr:TetR/AcrR family transcriptional regulator [Pseudonocardia sp. TRM90224]
MARPLRADAARNRDKLLVAAADAFAEHGLDTPLEDIARRAGVSIGTLYNHFPQRAALIGAIFPDRLSPLGPIAEAALADADPWRGFVSFVEGLFALQANDRTLNDAVARKPPGTIDPAAECMGFDHVETIIERAKTAGALRADFAPSDLTALVWAVSRVIQESDDPQGWRRFVGIHLDGLRAR